MLLLIGIQQQRKFSLRSKAPGSQQFHLRNWNWYVCVDRLQYIVLTKIFMLQRDRKATERCLCPTYVREEGKGKTGLKGALRTGNLSLRLWGPCSRTVTVHVLVDTHGGKRTSPPSLPSASTPSEPPGTQDKLWEMETPKLTEEIS